MSTVSNGSRTRIPAIEPSTNGAPRSAAVNTDRDQSTSPQTTAVEILAQLTPNEVTSALEELERKYAAQTDTYVRQKKLLTMVLKGLGVKRSKFSATAADERTNKREAIVELVRELKKADKETIVDRLNLPRNGVSLMLKSLVAKSELKLLKSGEYAIA